LHFDASAGAGDAEVLADSLMLEAGLERNSARLNELRRRAALRVRADRLERGLEALHESHPLTGRGQIGGARRGDDHGGVLRGGSGGGAGDPAGNDDAGGVLGGDLDFDDGSHVRSDPHRLGDAVLLERGVRREPGAFKRLHERFARSHGREPRLRGERRNPGSFVGGGNLLGGRTFGAARPHGDLRAVLRARRGEYFDLRALALDAHLLVHTVLLERSHHRESADRHLLSGGHPGGRGPTDLTHRRFELAHESFTQRGGGEVACRRAIGEEVGVRGGA